MTDDDGVESGGRLSDLRTMDRLTQSLSRSSESFGKSIVSAFSRGVVEGKRFEDVLRSVGRSMTDSLLKTALKPLQAGLSSLLSTGVKSLSGSFGGVGHPGGCSHRFSIVGFAGPVGRCRLRSGGDRTARGGAPGRAGQEVAVAGPSGSETAARGCGGPEGCRRPGGG